jgi:hypothetical protein
MSSRIYRVPANRGRPLELAGPAASRSCVREMAIRIARSTTGRCRSTLASNSRNVRTAGVRRSSTTRPRNGKRADNETSRQGVQRASRRPSSRCAPRQPRASSGDAQRPFRGRLTGVFQSEGPEVMRAVTTLCGGCRRPLVASYADDRDRHTPADTTECWCYATAAASGAGVTHSNRHFWAPDFFPACLSLYAPNWRSRIFISSFPRHVSFDRSRPSPKSTPARSAKKSTSLATSGRCQSSPTTLR